MRRSALYALIWSKPVIHAAKELGISDVGLSKACRRNGIPLPPRGHWMKLNAGKSSPQTPLPQPMLDPEVSLATSDPVRRQHQVEEQKARTSDVARKVKEVREVAAAERAKQPGHDERPHALVKATEMFYARLPALVARHKRTPVVERLSDGHERPPYKEHERWHINAPGGLIFTASDTALAGVLRLHDTVFRALTRAGGKVARRETKEREGAAIICELAGERISFSLREGYRRLKHDDATLARMRAQEGWASATYYQPSGKLTWTVAGTEHSLSRSWMGTQTQLEAKLDEITATCLEFLERQSIVRRDRLAEEQRRRIAAEEAEHKRRAAAGRREQLEHAFKAAAEYDRVQSLRRFLDVLETEIPTYREPYGERAAVWLKIVREELALADPYRAIVAQSLSVPSWRAWPPDWWPKTAEESNDGSPAAS